MNRRPFVLGLGVAAIGTALYALRRQLLGAAMGLPSVRYRYQIHRNIRVMMPDGVALATDHYEPQTGRPLPAILIRTPYGRKGLYGAANHLASTLFAERGYHVLCQDVRGRFESEGTFEPYVYEREDGLATLDWITAQPWCDGQVGTYGTSYLGYVQWAIATTNPPALKAIAPSLTQAHLAIGRGEGMMLDRMLRWLITLDTLDENIEQLPLWRRLFRLANVKSQDALVDRAVNHLPLAEMDQLLLGQPIPYFRRWVDQPQRYWQAVDFSGEVKHVEAPAYLVASWYDIFLKGALTDYEALRMHGRHPYLLIGPWTHTDPAHQTVIWRAGYEWFETHLKGKQGVLRQKPVRFYVMGADEWREVAAWPPPAQATRYYLQPEGGLGTAVPPPSEPDRYRYDPADPTPHLGGALLSSYAGPKDNRPLEARPDVLTYTMPPLTEDTEVIGPVTATLYVRSSLAHTDFFARLCDVQPDGASINICDGIFRVGPGKGERLADGRIRLEIDLWATAYRFKTGHAIRLQVSSGAHPRFARNLGTGEPVWSSTKMIAADQEIFHDPERPSALVLPIAE